MKIIRAKVKAAKTTKRRDIGKLASYNATKIVLNDDRIALVQRHNLELKQGDDVLVAGFSLFNRFMIMAFKNLGSGKVWANNGLVYLIMGFGVAVYPLVENRNYLNYGSSEWILLAIMAIIGGSFAYFGYSIYRAYLKLSAIDSAKQL